jgi:hypothetical protein
MALQVWLPLNDENVRNQGLADVTITNNGATYNSSGKIGGCWNIPSSTNSISLVNYMNVLKTYNNYSMCAWVYITDEPNGHSASILSSGTWSGTNSCLCFGFYNYDSGFNRLLIPSKGTWNSYINLSNKIVLNTWYHVAISYDGSKTIGYINGEYVGESSLGGICENSSSNNLKIGGVTYTTVFGLKGNINDVRIYDHCLSEDEIHELSLGKIGHWCLDNAEIEPTTNLGNINSNYSTFEEGKIYNASGWGGDTGTVTYYKHGGYNDGPYKVYHKLTTGSGGIYSRPNRDIIIESGKTYTMSIYVKSNRDFIDSSYSFTINRGTDNRYIPASSPVHFTTNWTRVVRTFTATDDDAGVYGEVSIVYNDAVDDYYVYFSCFQIEEKDHATPYVNGTRVGYCPDISGNHYDLTVNGNPTLSNDSVRYNRSTLFDGSNYLSCTSPTAEAKTLSLWAYVESIPASAVLFADYKSKLALGFYSSGTQLITRCGGVSSTLGSTNLINLNSWNHFCVVNGETN